jgi:hypothetical protein
MEDIRNAYILVGKSEGKGSPTHRWKYNISYSRKILLEGTRSRDIPPFGLY